MITIVIVEDQGILRESLACTLNLQEDMQVARALSDAADALDVVRETNANLALLDVCTENGSSGIAAAKQIREACPDTKIVIMTGMPEITFIEQAKLDPGSVGGKQGEVGAITIEAGAARKGTALGDGGGLRGRRAHRK